MIRSPFCFIGDGRRSTEKSPLSAFWAAGGRLLLEYRFSVGHESFIGETACPGWYVGTAAINVGERLPVGRTVKVRYRPDNPSVNKLDRSVWEDLDAL